MSGVLQFEQLSASIRHPARRCRPSRADASSDDGRDDAFRKGETVAGGGGCGDRGRSGGVGSGAVASDLQYEHVSSPLRERSKTFLQRSQVRDVIVDPFNIIRVILAERWGGGGNVEPEKDRLRYDIYCAAAVQRWGAAAGARKGTHSSIALRR